MTLLGHRTRAQREADRIDLELDRIADAIEKFAGQHADRDDKTVMEADARLIRSARTPIRKYMHRVDVELTK